MRLESFLRCTGTTKGAGLDIEGVGGLEDMAELNNAWTGVAPTQAQWSFPVAGQEQGAYWRMSADLRPSLGGQFLPRLYLVAPG